jgi:hypothetical protein
LLHFSEKLHQAKVFNAKNAEISKVRQGVCEPLRVLCLLRFLFGKNKKRHISEFMLFNPIYPQLG